MNKALALTVALSAATMMPAAAQAAATVNIGTGANWTITGPNGNQLGTNTPANNQIPSTWAPSVPGSAWISPNNNPRNATSPDGNYTFSGVFNLSNIELASTTWAVTWFADNIVRQILVNNTLLYSNPNGSGLSQEFVTPGISKVFTQNVWRNGANTITFVVTNGTGTSGNPTGLRVASVLTAVPEPGTWMLMILGLGAVGFAMRRRQKTSVRLQFA